MKRYEAMFILSPAVKNEDVEQVLTSVRGEIEKLGGVIESTTRLGRRPFARMLGGRHEEGIFSVVTFQMDGERFPALRARYKLDENVFRVQIVVAPERPPENPESPAAEGAPHGVA